MKLVIGSDDAGFGLKTDLAAFLKGSGLEIVDVGTSTYPGFVGAKFTKEERHLRRLNKVRAIESGYLDYKKEKSA